MLFVERRERIGFFLFRDMNPRPCGRRQTELAGHGKQHFFSPSPDRKGGMGLERPVFADFNEQATVLVEHFL